MSKSVGKIVLDLEIQSDIKGQINMVASQIGKGLKNSLQNASKQGLSGIKTSMAAVIGNMKQNFSAMGASLKAVLKKAMSQFTKVKQLFSKQKNSKTPKEKGGSATQKRGPPKNQGNIKSMAVNIPKTIIGALSKLPGMAFGVLGKFVNIVKKVLGGLAGFIGRALKPVAGLVGKAFNGLFSIVKGPLKKVSGIIGPAFKKGMNAAKPVLQGTTKLAKTAFSKLAGTVGNILGSIPGKMKGAFSTVKGFIGGLGKGMAKMGTVLKVVGGGFGALGKKLLGLVNYKTVFDILKKGFDTMKKSLVDSIKTNNEFQKSLKQINSNLAVAVTPIYQAVIPAINALMSVIVKITGYIAAFTSSLFGKTLQSSVDVTKGLEKAKDAMEEYGASAEEAGKAAQNSLGIDEMNIIEQNPDRSSAGSGSSSNEGFEVIETDNKLFEFADKFKNALQPTIEALGRLKEALEPLKNFAFGTLQDFYDKFLVPVGKWILGEGLPHFLNITTDLIKKVDWERLRTCLSGLYEQLERFTRFVFTGVLDFYEKFLSPIASWVLNEAIVKLVDVFVGFADKVNWEKINNSLRIFWEGLSKFSIGIGSGIVDFFTGIGKALTPALVTLVEGLAKGLEFFGSIIGNMNEGILRAIGGAIGAVCTEIAAFKAMQGVWTIIQNIGKALSGFLTTVSSHPIMVIVGLLGALGGAIIAMNEGWKQDLAKALEDYMSGTKDLRNQAQIISSEIDGNLQKIGSNRSAIESEYGAVQTLADKYYELSQKQNKSNGEKNLMLAYGQELVKRIPELRGLIDEETGAYKGTKDMLDGVIKKTREYYLVQAAQESLIDLYKNIYEAEKNRAMLSDEMGQKTKRLTELTELHAKAEEGFYELRDEKGSNINAKVKQEMILLEEELKALTGEYNNLGVGLDEANKELEYTNGYISEHTKNVDDAQKAIDDLSYAEMTINAANALDELHGVWGENGVQILGQDAVDIYNEIMEGLEPLENGMYQLADGSMVQFGSGLENGAPNAVSTLDKELLSAINSTLSSSGKVIGYENGNLMMKELVEGADANKDALKNSFEGYATYSQKGFTDKINDLTPDMRNKMDRFAKDGILDPFKSSLDINSPSKKFEEFGSYTVQGFNEGISRHKDSSKGVIGEWTRSILDLFHVAWKGIQTVFQDTPNWFQNIFKNTYSNIQNAIEPIGVFFRERYADVQDAFRETPVWFQDTFRATYENVQIVIEPIGEFFRGKYRDVQDAFQEAPEWFKATFKTTYDNITSTFDPIKNFFADIGNALETAFKNGIEGARSIMNKFIGWVNKNLNISWDSFRIEGVEVIPSGSFQLCKVPPIPALAQGGYVGANTPQLAMIGDNRHQGEVVAPEDKLRKMAMEAVQLAGKENHGDTQYLIQMIALLKDIINLVKNFDMVVNIDVRDLHRKLGDLEKRMGYSFT